MTIFYWLGGYGLRRLLLSVTCGFVHIGNMVNNGFFIFKWWIGFLNGTYGNLIAAFTSMVSLILF